jgi:hypothetical protein
MRMTPTDRNLPGTPTNTLSCSSQSNRSHNRLDGLYHSSGNIKDHNRQQLWASSIQGHHGTDAEKTSYPNGNQPPPNFTVLNNDVFDHASPNNTLLLCSQMKNALANERAKRMEAERLIAQNVAEWTRRLSEMENEWQSKVGAAKEGQPPQQLASKSHMVDAETQVVLDNQERYNVLKECGLRVSEAETWLKKAKLGSSVNSQQEEMNAFKGELIRLMDDLSSQIMRHHEKTKYRQSMVKLFLCKWIVFLIIYHRDILNNMYFALSRTDAGELETLDYPSCGTERCCFNEVMTQDEACTRGWVLELDSTSGLAPAQTPNPEPIVRTNVEITSNCTRKYITLVTDCSIYIIAR